MFIIFLSVTIVCYCENVAFIFKSCAIYFYLRFYILFSRLLFLYLWLQYFRWESDPIAKVSTIHHCKYVFILCSIK